MSDPSKLPPGLPEPVDDDAADHLSAIGAAVYGMSAQPPEEQQRFAERMSIPFPLLNDAELTLAEPPLRLPTFTAGGFSLYRRITLVARAGRIGHVRYPVFPPDRDASEVIAWLKRVR